MSGFALKFTVLWGWRRFFVTVLAGIVTSLAAPPIYLLPAALLGLPVFIWLLDGIQAQGSSVRERASAAFLTGSAFGFGYFGPNLYWVSEAFLVDADVFAWMIPFVVILFPLGLGIFYGLACMLASVFWAPGLGRIAALASSLTAMEWLRGHIFTGFPWANLGYAAGALEGLEQLAAFCSVYGLTFLICFVFSAPAVLAGASDETTSSKNIRPLGLICVAGLAMGLWAFGNYRLNSGVLTYDQTAQIRIVQPNIPQHQKWDPRFRAQNFSTLLELSDSASSLGIDGARDVSILIWPESAIPFLLEGNPAAHAQIADLLQHQSILMTGALRRAPAVLAGKRPNATVNSVMVLDADGKTIAAYDKSHLVPFGEYLPFASLLEPFGLRKMVTLPGGFVAGPGARTLNLPSIPPVSVLICYEVIFPGAVTGPPVRPQWLLNVTNDAWFGQSIGPRQHFAQSRMRAIEEGLPLIRAANTGISAVVGPYGRILQKLPIGVRGVLDSRLPHAIPATFYARYGDLTVLLIVLLGLGGAMLSKSKQRRPLARTHTIS